MADLSLNATADVTENPPQAVSFAPGSTSITVTEGNSGQQIVTFTVQRTGGTAGDLHFTVNVDPSSGLLNGDDFGGAMPSPIQGVILDGQATATFTLTYTGDTRYEAKDGAVLSLVSASNDQAVATVAKSNWFSYLYIDNDDAAPSTVAAGDIVEGPLTVTGNGRVVVEAGGLLSTSGPVPITWSGANSQSVIDNYGTIQTVLGSTISVAASARGTLTINNHVGAQILGAIDFNGQPTGATETLNNEGLIQGGLRLSKSSQAGAVINNLATGVITATTANTDLLKNGGNISLNNWGQIVSAADTETSSGGDAVDFDKTSSNTVHNYSGGRIEGSHHAVTGSKGITVINDAGGVMIGRNGSAVNMDNDATVATTAYITNRGTMTGASTNSADSDGDAIDVDGLAVIDNYGLVQGIGANGYHNGEANVSEGIAIGGGVINNYAGATIYGYGRAIQVDNSSNGPALGATTIYNEGVIQGDGHGPTGVSDADAAAMNANIVGREAIDILGSFADTITNKGKIIGGVFTDAGDDVFNAYVGSTVSGKIDLGAGNDTVNLLATPGSAATGVIGQMVNVETLNVVSGKWTLGYGFDGANINVRDGASIATTMSLEGGHTLNVDQGGSVIGVKTAIFVALGNVDANINNNGVIKVTSAPGTDKADAISINGATLTLHNGSTGYIEGGRHAVTGPLGIHVINDAGGVIVGRNGSAVNMDNSPIVAYTAYVDNYGTMLGDSANISDSDGDAVDVDGFAVINNWGSIRGEGANGYHKGEANISEGIAIGGGSVHNYAGGNIYGYGRAIEVDNSSNAAAFSSTTIINEGIIEGGGHGPTNVAQADIDLFAGRLKGGEAINIIGSYADTITNSGGIFGGVKTDGGDDVMSNSGMVVAKAGSAVNLGDGNDTFTNSGIVSGDVLLGAGNDTINIVVGSTISGMIDGGDGVDTLNLQGTGNGGTLGAISNVEKIDVQGGTWAVGDSSAAITVESGANLVINGTVTGSTVAAGGAEYVYGSVTSSTVAGEQLLESGATASDTTIETGGLQTIYVGATASDTTIAGGGQMIWGSADDTTIQNGGLQYVHGSVTDTTVGTGGQQNVYADGTATGTTVGAGGFQLDWGAAIDTTIDGGTQFVYGTATGTSIVSGVQHIAAGATATDTSIGNGGTEYVHTGGSAHDVTFAGPNATLVLDQASDLSGTISGWQFGDVIDFGDIGFDAQGTTFGYAENADHSGGTLTVTDGTHTATLALLGQYTASDFALASDGHGGTTLTDPTAPAQVQNLLAPAHG